jgi:hypothetical protein
MPSPDAPDAVQQLIAKRRACGCYYCVQTADELAHLRETVLLPAITKVRALMEAADRIKHWHDAMADNSGMVVSKDSVFETPLLAGKESKREARSARSAIRYGV